MTEHMEADTRREQILQAAAKLFDERGYENTTVDEIAREAGLSKGSIYWYYNSKLDILFAVSDRCVSESQQMILSVGAANRYGPEALHKAHRELLGWLDERPEHQRLFQQLTSLSQQHPEIRARLKAYHDMWDQTLAALIQRNIEKGHFRPVDPVLLARAIHALYYGLYQRRTVQPETDMLAVIETIMKLVYDGLTLNQTQEPGNTAGQ